MADLRIVDAPEIPTNSITGQEKLPTGGNGNYSISLDSLADYTKTKKDLADNTSVDNKVNGVRQELDAHIEDLLNPHQVTKGQIGLGNVDNTADADKPVSNSTQAAIISAVLPKADKTYVDNQLTQKADKTYVDNALSSKSDKTYVDSQLTLKAYKVDVYTKSETYTKQESGDLVNNSISTALTPVNASLDLAKRGVVNRYDPSFTYNSGERVILTNGDIVKSTIDGNTNDPNVDMTGWILDNQISSIKIENGTGSGKNITVFPEYNAIAPDVSASIITGGGNSAFPNKIGYTESLDVFVGDGTNKTFLTTFDTSGSTDVSVWLVRADGVLTEVTAYTARTQVGSKTQVYYPKEGHFVNDAVGGSEGTNPALLSTQKLRVVRKTKNYIENSNSNYCGIYGGYDNLQIGIMCHQIGAHHRISGGDHHSQFGGSYNTTLGGAYTATLGGTKNTLGVNCGSSAVIIGGSSISNNSSSGWSIGGYNTSISGNRAGSLGAYGSTNSGSDSIIGGHTVNNTGAAAFIFGQNLNNSGNYSVAYGFNNQNTGFYSHIYGRDNSNTKDYSETGGRYAVGRTEGARTYANGRISTNGDAQTQSLVMNLQTTNATATYAKTTSGNQQVFIAENSNNLVTVRAVASDISTDDSASFELKFHVKRKGGVTTIMGTPTPTKIYNDTNASTWNIVANASSTLAMFRISCTGEASKTINWSMSIEIVEVSRV